MQLTAYSDYALRVLMYLGAKRMGGGRVDDELSSIDEIAGAYDISRNHLMKVVHHLGKQGFIETVRGRKGGLRLAKPPKEIVVGAVVRSTESFPLAPCFAEDGKDVGRALSVLRDALEEALAGFLDALDRYTLADLIEDPTPATALLRIERKARPTSPSTRPAAKAVNKRERVKPN